MCVFCNIVSGEIPSYKIYEDKYVLAFLDISQVTKGHTLVIPKKHIDNFVNCDDQTLEKVTLATKRIAQHLYENLDCKGINILSNIDELAGQSVFHFHMHIIPRYSENDACHIEFKESELQNLELLQKKLAI